jgi:hypothetical protein
LTDTADFSALLDKKADLEKQIQTEAKEVFTNASKDIFEKYGDKVGVFGWQQYTPYFNDGEPCVFSKGELFIYSPEEVEDPNIETSYWETEGIFGSHVNERYHYKDLKGDYTFQWQPYRYKGEPERYEKFENPDWDPNLDLSAAKNAVTDLCNLIDKDTALSLFGDHITVIVTPEGVETEECEHE